MFPARIATSRRNRRERRLAGRRKVVEVFQDAELQRLIRKGLTDNYDVQIAASRILQAQAQVGITRAQQFPAVAASAGYTSEKIPSFTYNLIQLGALLLESDFWGMYRRATEAARANVLAAEWARRRSSSTLVSNIALAYFDAARARPGADDPRQTLASRRESLGLTRRCNGGAAALVDVRQAEQLVETAAETIPDTERQIAQQEDLIGTLIGDNPHAIPRGHALTEQPAPPEVPAGLPFAAAGAAAGYPRGRGTTGRGHRQHWRWRVRFLPFSAAHRRRGDGARHLAASSLRRGGVEFQRTLTQPIFEAGRLRSNLRLSEAQQQQALLTTGRRFSRLSGRSPTP